MIVPEIKPRVVKNLNDINGGECFLHETNIMIKLQTHYVNSVANSVRLADGAQCIVSESGSYEVLGHLKVSF